MSRNFFSLCILVSIGLLCRVSIGAESSVQPDGHLTLKSQTAAVGVGYSWGEGVLTYRGHHYPFRIAGLSAGDVGVSEATATGAVYHLKTLNDFEGNYTAADAGVTVGGGMGIAAMRNEKGVVVQLHSTNRGIEFTLGASGVKMELNPRRSGQARPSR